MFAERAFYCIANGAGELFFRRFILCVDPLQICVDEGVETAVQYAVCICNLLICPKVLHQLIRLQDIGTDLVAPCDILDLATDVRKLLGVFLPALTDTASPSTSASPYPCSGTENAHSDTVPRYLSADA